MKLRGLLMLLISLGLAAVAAVAANRWMTERLDTAVTNPDLVGVVAAANEIPFGTSVDATLVKVIELHKEAVPEKAFTSVDDVIGLVAAQTLYKGETLLEGRVVEHVGGSALAAVVQEGMRAVTVRVNDIAGVAGFLLPGNRVDVIATRRVGGRRTEAQTLVQNLKVLAVDQTTSPDKNDPVIVRAVTLEANPDQAEEIARAMEEGKVQLTLRNPLDGTRREPPEVAASEPDAEEVAETEPPPTIPRADVVVVIRGTDIKKEIFNDEQPVLVDFAR